MTQRVRQRARTRAFDELGDTAFNALQAPLRIDSYDLEEQVLSDGLVEPMLESLDELGLRGVGVLPGPLRRPLGKRPSSDKRHCAAALQC